MGDWSMSLCCWIILSFIIIANVGVVLLAIYIDRIHKETAEPQSNMIERSYYTPRALLMELELRMMRNDIDS